MAIGGFTTVVNGRLVSAPSRRDEEGNVSSRVPETDVVTGRGIR